MTVPTSRPDRPPLPPLPPRRPRTPGPVTGTTRSAATRSAPTRAASPIVLVPVIFVGVAMIGLLATLLDPDLGADAVPAVVAFVVLTGIAALVAGRMGRSEVDFDLRSIVVTGFAVRVIGGLLRFRLPVDAYVYHQEGIRIASELRNFNLAPDVGKDALIGTGWIRYVSGVTHVIGFDDMLTSFLLFTFLSFVGACLCYLAFARAVPEGHRRRYALLIFLWPSLVYWPSSLGKEAWMVLGLGLASWGVSRVLTQAPVQGVPVFALGLLTMAMVRPHVALMTVIGFTIALLVRPKTPSTRPRLAVRLAVIALLLVGGSLVASRVNETLKTDSDGTENIASGLDRAVEQTQQGGASFSPAVVRTPLDYPVAFVTVWVRPLPTEARGGEGGLTQLLSSAEGLLLIGLFAASWRQLAALPRSLVRIPYVTYAAVYAAVFVFAFSAIANFGILARQRTQGVLLLFVVLCVPTVAATARERTPARRRGHTPTTGAGSSSGSTVIVPDLVPPDLTGRTDRTA